ncbi:hypothetical protein CDE51_08135 [Pasteurella multocida]|nr:hypothetical protein CDE51_08135 [Pasteurella multocida]
MLYAVEQEYIPIRSFMENFKSQYQKDISLDELITLFLNDKISFYLHIKGNQNKISISPNSPNCHYGSDSFDIEFCMYKKHVCTAVRFNSSLIPQEENNIIISNIKDKTFFIYQ